VDDAAEHFVLGIEDVGRRPHRRIRFQRYRLSRIPAAGLAASRVREGAVGLLRKGTVRRHIEAADMAATEIADVQYAFGPRHCQTVKLLPNLR
jgi:hypothetical protein